MKKIQIKQRRRLILFLIMILILAIVLFLMFKKRDYTVTYNIDEFEIIESYHKDSDYYSFVLKKGENELFSLINNQHFTSKKIIKQITEYQEENETCLVLSSNKVRFDPLCYNEEGQISYHLTSESMKEKLEKTEAESNNEIIKTYNNINIYNDDYFDYYIWNYRGFYRLSQDVEETITLFNEDIYNPTLITQVGGILVIPDYNAEYYFDTVYLLDMNTGKTSTWILDTSIYFDSAILGVYDNELYLVDKHEKVEWKLNVEKNSQERVGTENSGGIIYQNDWTNVSMNRLIYQDNTFTGLNNLEYTLTDHGLYAVYDGYQKKVRETSPTSIVSEKNNVVFYLIDDNLYYFSESTGERLLMNYFEWDFNSQNVIFID